MNKKSITILAVLTLFSLTFWGCQSSDVPQPFPPGSAQARLAREIAELGPNIHDPSELQYENSCFMVFSTGKGIRSWYRDSATGS